eukprot:scaffold2129_cov107-Isochrysis_galbana.AAC.3
MLVSNSAPTTRYRGKAYRRTAAHEVRVATTEKYRPRSQPSARQTRVASIGRSDASCRNRTDAPTRA